MKEIKFFWKKTFSRQEVIDWNRFAESLVEAGYEGPLMLETSKGSSDLYSFLKKSWNSLNVFQYQSSESKKEGENTDFNLT